MLNLRPSIVLIFVCNLLVMSSSYIIESLPETHPDHPGKCWWSESSTAYSVGETFRISDACTTAICNNDFSVTITGCSIHIIDDEACQIVKPDLSLTFPKCCQKYECIGDKETRHRI